ncbi:tetratricopeptide repeat protein [Flavihumibacter profundi]|uniref:tetratricopeptide repeat protein n=1 Tax=Flavihumibacter profundi TaxID=2716883 RepID=UPI001CC4DF84|nr:tetratricopeptide repeat protein [Flavihumibacter profundi]MBZ5857663.1 hypothetical protein [Flavihumibacter profundi]
MNNNPTSELLMQYLDGDLEGQPLEALKIRLESDNSLKEEYQQLLLARDAVKLYGLKEKVSGIHAEMMRELKPQKAQQGGSIISMFRPVMRIAAVLLLLIGAATIYQFLQVSSLAVFEKNFQPYTIPETRGAPAASPLADAFKNGQTGKVIGLFKQLPQASAEDCFYTGNAYLQEGKPEEAISLFLLVQQKNAINQARIFSDDTEYYLAMAYLNKGQIDQAVPLFEKIHNHKDHLYHDKVNDWFMWRLWLLKKKL